MTNFPENLKMQRQSKNLSQEELGKLIGVSGVTIMRYEKGLRQPKLETVTKLASALKIPVANLIDLNSPIINKATKRFVSGNFPSEIDTYGNALDDIVINSPIGNTVNEFQSAIAELTQKQFELLVMCYKNLNYDDKKKLCDYACSLLENSDEYKQAVNKYMPDTE